MLDIKRRLDINKRLQENIDETFELSEQIINISERDNRELDKDMINDHLAFLEKWRKELKEEAKILEEKLLS